MKEFLLQIKNSYDGSIALAIDGGKCFIRIEEIYISNTVIV